MLTIKESTIILCSAIVLLMTSCSPSREKSISQITALENSLFSPDAVSFNKEKADSLLSLYDGFIKNNPKDSLAPGYLFKAANIVMNSGNGPRAIVLFDQYLKDYPDKPKASLCLFFKAFIYENVMQDIDKARETYLLFLEKYPSDDFTNDAEMALMNLGKTPDMLVREFEAKKSADSAK
jgi:outer membrane protein assembly factor BamD (BamD/ComL family)